MGKLNLATFGQRNREKEPFKCQAADKTWGACQDLFLPSQKSECIAVRVPEILCPHKDKQHLHM